MGIILWIVVGLVAGVIARAILPGKHGGGWIVTIALGVAGAVAGGFLAGQLFHVDLGGFFDTRTWLLAIGGAIAVLLIYGGATSGSRKT